MELLNIFIDIDSFFLFKIIICFNNRKEETEKMIEKVKEEETKRSARTNFAALLYELIDREQLTIDSTWKKIKPIIENDSRYRAISKYAIITCVFILFYFYFYFYFIIVLLLKRCSSQSLKSLNENIKNRKKDF